MALQRNSKALVIGIGNRDRGDDQVGVRVAERLQQRLSDSVDIVIHRGDPAYLIEQWQRRDLVVAVDAVVSDELSEGEVFCWDAANEELAIEPCHVSTHGLGVHEAIALAKALHKMPRSFYVYGVNAQSFTSGQAMSKAVCAGAEKVVAEITQRLKGEGDAQDILLESIELEAEAV